MRVKQYEIHAKCEVEKLVTVEARSIQEAEEKFNKGDWVDEIEAQMQDWEIIGTPKLIE